MTTTPIVETADAAFDCPGNYVAPTPTTLRCSKCNRPLATKDAQRTPTGYVCPYYVQSRVARFYSAGAQHYLVAVLIAFVFGIAIGFGLQLIGRIGFFAIILTLFAAPAAGGVVAEAIRRVNGKNRGQYIWLAASIALAIGSAPFTILPPLFGLLAGSPGFLFALIPTVGLALTISALVARLRI